MNIKRAFYIFLACVLCLGIVIPSYAVTNKGELVFAIAENAAGATAVVDNDSIITNKTIRNIGTDTFELTLESYVTGSTVTDQMAVGLPADIVMVMDHSDSMDECLVHGKGCSFTVVRASQLDTSKVYYYGSSARKALYYCDTCKGWFTVKHSQNDHTGDRYYPKEVNDNYYEREFCTAKNKNTAVYDIDISQDYYVKHGDSWHKITYCTQCNVWYRSSNNSHVNGGDHESYVYIPYADADNSNSIVDWYVIFRTTQAENELCIPRYIALELAVYEFLDLIYADAKGDDGKFGTDDDTAHRVAMVSFAGDSGGADNATNAVMSFKDSTNNYNDGRLTGPRIPYNMIDSEKDDYYEYYHQHMLQDVTTQSGRDVLNSTFSTTRLSTGTQTARGMHMAYNILSLDKKAIESRIDKSRCQVVVVFTDGEPTDDKPKSLTYSSQISELGATVYTVGTFLNANVDVTDNITDFKKTSIYPGTSRYMHLLSSNFPDATSYTNEEKYGELNPSVTVGEPGYFLVATDQNALKDIFSKIYETVQNGGAGITLDASTMVKDFVTDGFTINGTPQAHTETFLGGTSWSNNNDYVNCDYSGQTVTYSGFDYSTNYVGTDYSNGVGTPRGQKLVITIPIKISDSNLGGNQQYTNTEDSGVYDGNGNVQENFVSPSVDTPTKVTVKKIINNTTDNGSSSFVFSTNAKVMSSYSSDGAENGNYLSAGTSDATAVHNLTNNGTATVSNVKVGTAFTVNETVNTDDYNVTIKVTDAQGRDITSSVATVNGTECTINSVEPGMTVIYTNTEIVKTATLVINKVLDGDDTADQDFIFEITCADDSTFKLDVIIPASAIAEGKASVTVSGLNVGSYIVKELTAWSNRYSLTSVSAQNDKDCVSADDGITFKLAPSGEVVTFTNKRTEGKWLSGDSYAENYFADTGVIRKD